MSETDILAVLLEIRDELRQLNGSRRRPLDHREHMLLSKLIPAIRGELGSSSFTTRELLSRPWCPQFLPVELGNLLARACGEDIDGITILRVGHEHGAVIWQLGRPD